MQEESYINQILQGNNWELLEQLPEKSVDLIFADPPYNLQLENQLYRPNQSKVDGVFDQWDQFESLQAYDDFTRRWLTACKRVLKDNGTIWVIGSYHNIYRVGAIMQDLGFWFLNDILWIKTNPMPNFMGTRFNNAHETMLWASKEKGAKYTFHYKSLKTYNDDLQMRSDWYIPICSGRERLKNEAGEKVHSTQKPEELLFRVILSSSNAGDLVLDPFSGSGTTAAVAKRLGRRFVGLEKEEVYVKASRERLAQVEPLKETLLTYPLEVKPPKVPFGNLLEKGMIQVGETLYSKDKKLQATVNASAVLCAGELLGSIHKVSAQLLGKKTNNGWTFWYVLREGELVSINALRQAYIKEYLAAFHEEGAGGLF